MENFIKFRFFSIRAGRVPVLSVLFGLVLALPVLLSNCDIMGKSIDEFIDFNTGTAVIRDHSIISASPEAYTRTLGAIMYDPNPGCPYIKTDPGIIEFAVQIDNPFDYELEVTPVIDRFIGPKGPAPLDKPLVVIPGDTNSVFKIRLGSRDTPLTQGDSFEFHLELAMKDGSRKFNSYTKIPQIIFDNPLRSAAISNPKLTEAGDPGYGTYNWKTEWTIQNKFRHVGINRIDVFFRKVTDGAFVPMEFDKPDETFELSEDGEWINYKVGVEMDFSTLTPQEEEAGTKFVLPFPFNVPADASEDAVIEQLEFQVILWDKNGLSMSAGMKGSPETELKDLIVGFKYRGHDEFDFTRNDYWNFDFRNKLNYSPPRAVPNRVVEIIFYAVKATPESVEGFYGSQDIRWGEDTNFGDNPVYSSLLLEGPNTFKMQVHWQDPNDESVVKKRDYIFNILRTNPSKDSVLRKVIFQDGKPANLYNEDGGKYETTEDFYYDISDEDYPVAKTHYTVYVPSSVESIKILGDFARTAKISNEKGEDPNLKNYAPTQYPQFSIDGITFEYDEYPDSNEYYLYCRNGWLYNLDYGNNNFYYDVIPEKDYNGDLKRRYTFTVARTDPDANLNAKISELTVAGGAAAADTYLSPDLKANRFSPDILNYTVYLPNTLPDDTVKFSVNPASGTQVREITSINLDSNIGDPYLDYHPPVSGNFTVDIPFPSAPSSNVNRKRVTFTVFSTVDSTPKNYTITLIRCLPAVTQPKLDGYDKSLKVEGWTAGAGLTYEVCYDLFKNEPTEDIPELAAYRLDKFVSGSYISGLTNSSRYKVWVRSKDTVRPGEWVAARTEPLTGSPYYEGIPGAAELSDVNFKVNSAPAPDLKNSLSPAFSPGEKEYTLTVQSTSSGMLDCDPVSTTGALTVTGFAQYDSSMLSPGTSTSSPTIITVRSPDGKHEDTYSFTIKKNLSPPTNVSLTPQSSSAIMKWNGVSGATDYEIYYSTGATQPQVLQIMVPHTGSANAAHEANIQNLNNGIPYYFWIRARNASYVGDLYTVASTVIPNDGNGTIKIDLTNFAYTTVDTGNPVLAGNLSWKADDTLIITAAVPPAGYTTYAWYLDNMLAANNPPNVSGATTNTLNVRVRMFSEGTHAISVKVTNGTGQVLSGTTLTFTVLP